MLKQTKNFSSLNLVKNEVLAVWPEHAKFLEKSFHDQDEEDNICLELLADDIIKIAGSELRNMANSYKIMCDIFLEEELYFRRYGKYRCDSFAAAESLVYKNDFFMKAYMEGLLISQLLWKNHANSFVFYKNSYINRIGNALRHLEIGPGHGLYFAWAARHFTQKITGWDISKESLLLTERSLRALSDIGPTTLEQRNILDDAENAVFDSIVISEVLEHLEQPHLALSKVCRQLTCGGLIFINVPVNSPAPDHIYLFETPEQVAQMVTDAGLKLIEVNNAPMTGFTLERAIRSKATISCALIAQKPL